MKEFVMFVIFFILVYIMYYLFVVSRKKKVEKYYQSTEVKYLENRYHLNMKQVPIRKLANELALVNAFIISATASIASLLPNLILQICVGFLLLMVLIVGGYHIVGRYYQKKLGEEK